MSKQRFMKIMSWYLIISMVFQMLPVNLLVAWAESGAEAPVTETVPAENGDSLTAVKSGEIEGVPAYTVNFHTGEDTTELVEAGKTLESMPQAPVLQDAAFFGWNTAEDGSGQFIMLSTPITRDLDLYPVYTPTAAHITYLAGEYGTVTRAAETVSFLDGSQPFGSTAVADDGAAFVNWTDAEGNVVSEEETFIPTITVPAAPQEPGDPFAVLAAYTSEETDAVYTANFASLTAKNLKAAPAGAPSLRAADDENEVETWAVKFYDRDSVLVTTVNVPKGEPIGDQLPPTVARDDYDAYWAVGECHEGSQGNVCNVTGERINAAYTPEADSFIVADYDKTTYTVTFYQEDKTTVVDTRDVNVDSSYSISDMPDVPAKEGFSGKWVYADGDFNNTVSVNANTDVWAEYDQNVFTVTFKINEDDTSVYQSDTYYKGDRLLLPSDPVVEGKDFQYWVDKSGTKIEGGETVDSDMVITAVFKDDNKVDFVILNDDGTIHEQLSQYFRSDGEAIGTMPQNPFVAGKVFEKWVLQGTETEVTAETVVTNSMTVVAQFRTIDIYDITAEYYYLNDRSEEVIFNTDLLEVEAHELPYTITAPATTQTSPDEVSGAPIYYPETPTVTVTEDDFVDGKTVKIRFKYVPYTAEYDYVYLLKDLTGDGYTEIDRTSDVQGVLNSYVTPAVKTYDYAVLERAEGAVITQASGQELNVYYTRKNYQLTYETNGGSYVGGGTYPYGSSVELTTTVPTRTGYTFAGWYSDPELTTPVSGSVTIDGNTTLYAKWNGDTVNYTIVYMFEKYNDAGTASSYVYDNSRDGRGTVGSTVQASSAPSITRKGWVVDTDKNAASSVVIAADGSSVLYVYYKLQEYTFNFDAGTYSYGWSNYDVEATLTGKGVSGTGTLNYTMTVKIGQDISSSWPGNVTGRYYRDWRWRNLDFNGWYNPVENTRYVTKRTLVTEDMLPDTGTSITYTARWTNDANTYTVNYWLQNADDDDYTKSEEYSQTYTSSGGYLTAKEIAGYTYDHGNSGEQGVTTYNFYYNRDRFKIDYYYGSDLLDTISDIKFDANINKSPYVWTPTAAQCGVDRPLM